MSGCISGCISGCTKYYAHPTAVVESDAIGEGTKIWHFVHIRKGSKIGMNCNIGKSVYIDADAVIGNNVKIQNFVSVYKGVMIEDDVFVGPSATFTNDLYPRAFIWDEEHVVQTYVRKGASIGANSTIICGTTIGEYAMIGAGSVVVKDVPAFGLVYGSPAEFKGYVCYCGKRLEKIITEDATRVIFRCDSCGKDVEISRRD